MRDVDHIIIHCAATPPTADIGAVDIDKWHRAKGWWGCGYHYVIRRDGTIESAARGNRTRPLEKSGAHVGDCGPGWNKRSVGVCLVGGVDKDMQPQSNFTMEQFESLQVVLAELEELFPGCTIMGHRDLIKLTGAPPKACPSFDVKTWLSGLPTDWYDRAVKLAR